MTPQCQNRRRWLLSFYRIYYFKGCINLTLLTLIFTGCTSLTVLPGDLLKNNILLSGAGSTFYGCTSLVNILPTLFASCSLITSFGATLQNSGVEEIPEKPVQRQPAGDLLRPDF